MHRPIRVEAFQQLAGAERQDGLKLAGVFGLHGIGRYGEDIIGAFFKGCQIQPVVAVPVEANFPGRGGAQIGTARCACRLKEVAQPPQGSVEGAAGLIVRPVPPGQLGQHVAGMVAVGVQQQKGEQHLGAAGDSDLGRSAESHAHASEQPDPQRIHRRTPCRRASGKGRPIGGLPVPA